MPLYEYQCDKCGGVFEVVQKFSDEPLTTHEECGGAVHRLISAPALQFKGSGWYITDYAKSGSAKTSNETKTEGSASKPAAGSESPSSSSPTSSNGTSDKK